jgi:hypothetical protein
MAKLDEIAELLTEELHNFEEAVNRLEEVRQSLEQYHLVPDTSEVNFLLEGYNDRQKKILDEQNELLRNLSYRVNDAVLIPDLYIKIFWVWCFLNLLVWGLSVATISKWPEKQEIAFQKGKEAYIQHFQDFFDQHPEEHEAYLSWIKQSEEK